MANPTQATITYHGVTTVVSISADGSGLVDSQGRPFELPDTVDIDIENGVLRENGEIVGQIVLGAKPAEAVVEEDPSTTVGASGGSPAIGGPAAGAAAGTVAGASSISAGAIGEMASGRDVPTATLNAGGFTVGENGEIISDLIPEGGSGRPRAAGFWSAGDGNPGNPSIDGAAGAKDGTAGLGDGLGEGDGFGGDAGAGEELPLTEDLGGGGGGGGGGGEDDLMEEYLEDPLPEEELKDIISQDPIGGDPGGGGGWLGKLMGVLGGVGTIAGLFGKKLALTKLGSIAKHLKLLGDSPWGKALGVVGLIAAGYGVFSGAFSLFRDKSWGGLGKGLASSAAFLASWYIVFGSLGPAAWIALAAIWAAAFIISKLKPRRDNAVDGTKGDPTGVTNTAATVTPGALNPGKPWYAQAPFASTGSVFYIVMGAALMSFGLDLSNPTVTSFSTPIPTVALPRLAQTMQRAVGSSQAIPGQSTGLGLLGKVFIQRSGNNGMTPDKVVYVMEETDGEGNPKGYSLNMVSTDYAGKVVGELAPDQAYISHFRVTDKGAIVATREGSAARAMQNAMAQAANAPGLDERGRAGALRIGEIAGKEVLYANDGR